MDRVATFKDRGIVLRETESGESDKMLTVLLKERGKVSIYARGARKPNSKFYASCSLFCYSDLVLFQKGEFLSVSSADVINGFVNIRNDYDAFLCACFITELVDKIIFSNMETEKILRLLALSLRALNKGSDLGIVRPAFSFKLMQMEGFTPVLEKCARCNSDVTQYFSQDGTVCENCRSEIDTPVSKGTVKAIDYIINSETDKMFGFNLDKALKTELSLACDLFIRNNLEIRLKSDEIN